MLGPLLFIFYMFNLIQVLKVKSLCVLFANYAKLFKDQNAEYLNDFEELQKQIDRQHLGLEIAPVH